MAKEYRIEHRGEVKHVIDDHRPKGITVRLVLSWIFSIPFLLSGVSYVLQGSIPQGLLLILSGLIIFPPLVKAVRNNWNFQLSSWLTFFILLFLLTTVISLNIQESFSNYYDLQEPGTPSITKTGAGSNTPPKQQTVTSDFYTEEDVTDAIAEGKVLADNFTQKVLFSNKYISKIETGVWVMVWTPYASAVNLVWSYIEKYDPVNADLVRIILSRNAFAAGASGLPTSQAFYEWNKDDLRAVVEYGDGKVCLGEISSVESSYARLSSDLSPIYETSVHASFEGCFSEVRNRTVTIAFVLGSEKFRFENIDMAKLR